MKGKRIAVLESRFGEHLAGLLEKKGAVAMRAPALAEEPDVDPGSIRVLVDEWMRHPFRVVIFQTGVGTRALFEATDALGIGERLSGLLADCVVVARGPKPTAVLRGRSIRIDLNAAEPYTTAQVLDAIKDIALSGERVLVQRYGDANEGLDTALRARGASVVEVPLYRWALPSDIGPLVRLIGELGRGTVDATVFTSASQVRNLFSVAKDHGGAESLRKHLNATLVASIGPVCSDALRSAGVEVELEASPPKLGPLVESLEKALKKD